MQKFYVAKNNYPGDKIRVLSYNGYSKGLEAFQRAVKRYNNVMFNVMLDSGKLVVIKSIFNNF